MKKFVLKTIICTFLFSICSPVFAYNALTVRTAENSASELTGYSFTSEKNKAVKTIKKDTKKASKDTKKATNKASKQVKKDTKKIKKSFTK